MTTNSPQDVDTDQLLQRASGGDGAAVNSLLKRHRDRLREMVRLRLDPRIAKRVDPSDVVQETLTDAFQKLPEYLERRPIPFYPWLRQLAGERLARQYRRHVQAGKRSVQREDARDIGLSDESAMRLASQLAAGGRSAAGQLAQQEILQRVRDALQEVSPPLREALLMRHVEQMSLEEISSAVGVPVGTVKSRVFRALEQLHRLLADLLPEDGA